MGREVTFGQEEDSRRAMGFKLVKSSGNYVKPGPFSDSIHYYFKVVSPGYPHAIDVTDEVLHLIKYLGALHFI